MSPHPQRTGVVLLLAAVVGVRIAATQRLPDSAAAVSHDPQAAIATAFQGWTTQGTLGSPTAQGIRSLPLALYYVGGQQVGMSDAVLQAGLRTLLLMMATLGALRLVRAQSDSDDSWATWLAALLYGCGATLAAATAQRPMDALAAAVAPWLLTPLIGRRWGWRGAARSAIWLGPAGFASTPWAAAVLVAGLLTAAPRHRRELRQLLIWLLLAGLASSWWLFTASWERLHAVDVSALVAPTGVIAAMESALGWSDLPVIVTLAACAAPFLVAGLALAVRAPGLDRILVAGLTLAAAVGVLVIGTGVWCPADYVAAEGTSSLLLGPPLLWAALAGLLGLVPLLSRLRHSRTSHAEAAHRRHILVMVAGGVVLVASGLSVALAARERVEPENAVSTALWQQVAQWSADAPDGRVLVLPAAAAADRSVVARALGDRAWVDRTAVPASGTAATAALDTLIGRLRRGQLGAGTSAAMDHLGISYVVIRDDLPDDHSDPSGNALARRALAAEGATRVAAFYTDDGAATYRITDFGTQPTAPGIEVWARPRPSEAAQYPAVPVDAVGDVGTMSDLADAGVLSARPIRLNATSADQAVLLSDSARRRDADQRVPIDPYGPVLQAEEQPSANPPGAAPTETSLRQVDGARAVTASSSAADLGSTPRRVGTSAVAAIDGNGFTSWESAGGTGVGQWWQIDFERPTEVTGTEVSFRTDLLSRHAVTGIRAETDSTSVDLPVEPGAALSLNLPGRTKHLRLVVTEVATSTSATDRVGISEVRIPGVQVTAGLQLPAPGTAWLLGTLPGSSATCVPAAVPWETDSGEHPEACDDGLAVQGFDSGSVQRTVSASHAARVGGVVWVRPALWDQAAQLADRLASPSVRAEASSVATSDLRTRAQSAVDTDTTTAWRPAPSDPTPKLTLRWEQPAEVSRLRLVQADPRIASQATRVRISDGARELVTTSPSTLGWINFPPTSTDSLTLEFLADSGLKSADSGSLAVRPVPIAVQEVEVDGVDVRYDVDTFQQLPCGSGPEAVLAGHPVATSVRASAGDLAAGRTLRARLCSDVTIPQGRSTVEVAPTFEWTPLGVMIGQPGLVSEAGDWGPDRARSMRVDLASATTIAAADLAPAAASRSSFSTLALSLPADSGWTLHRGEAAMPAVTLDGWSQGWLLPPGAEDLTLRYAPGRTLTLGVLLGWLAWAVVLLVALLPSSRRSGAMAASGSG